MFEFLSQKFSGILSWVKDKRRLTDQNIQDAFTQVRQALLEADVPLSIVDEFLASVKNEVIGQKVLTGLNPGQNLIKIVHQKLLDFLGGKNLLPPTSFQIPSVIMVMGLQGSGKTTTIAKIAHFVLKQAEKKGKKRRILFASVDFYRPAAVQQLRVLSEQVGVDFYAAQSNDPVTASSQIYDYFKNNSYELLFLDTAGRLHIDSPMMEELKSIDKSVAPKHKILVLDAMTGQESLNVARSFEQSIGFQSSVLSKMDSDTRGGAAFAFRYALNKSIAFVGDGEKISDLEIFIPDRMASRILGMGDVLTLIEQAEEKISKTEQESAAKKIMSGNFSLQDFADQMDMIGRLGPLQKIAKFMPGIGSVSPEMMEKGQGELKVFKAIISSMNKKERIIPNILNGSRKLRIAKGAGVSVQEINQLLQKFEQSKQFVKMFKKAGAFKKFLR